MYKVGITGGIGSGKTTVCRIFEILGIPVYYADFHAKYLMENDPSLILKLKKNFGDEIYHSGKLDRKKLSGIIFQDKEALEKVNGIVHPAVALDFIQWSQSQTSPYVLEESAILFEKQLTSGFRKIILVTAPENLRVKRVCERDHISMEAVYERIKNQWPDDKKITAADFVICNDDLHMLIPQVWNIHKKLMQFINSNQ